MNSPEYPGEIFSDRHGARLFGMVCNVPGMYAPVGTAYNYPRERLREKQKLGHVQRMVSSHAVGKINIRSSCKCPQWVCVS